MGELRDLHYESLEHPPYSPDFAPSDFYLFPKLKLFLAGQRFSSNQEAIAAVRGSLQIFRRTTTGTGKWRWSIAGINVLVLREIVLKNRNNFEIIS